MQLLPSFSQKADNRALVLEVKFRASYAVDAKKRPRRCGLVKPKRCLNPFASLFFSQRGRAPRRVNALLPRSGNGLRYLEIGVFRGRTLEAVRAKEKFGVDPFPQFRVSPMPTNIQFHCKTSRSFFSSYDGPQFDFVFLDGLHTAEETYRDFVDSLNFLHPNGMILIDDVLPSDYESALPDQEQSKRAKELASIEHNRWYGDVWKLAILILRHYSDLELVLIGKGGEDHSQAAVRLRQGSPIPKFDQEADIKLMGTFDFLNCVVSGENCLKDIAMREKLALEKLQ